MWQEFDPKGFRTPSDAASFQNRFLMSRKKVFYTLLMDIMPQFAVALKNILMYMLDVDYPPF